MNWSEKYLKEKLPHDGLGFLNTVTMDKLKTYGEICRLEGMMEIAKSHSQKRQFEKQLEKLLKKITYNNERYNRQNRATRQMDS